MHIIREAEIPFLMPVTGELREMHHLLNAFLSAPELTQPKLSCWGLALIRCLFFPSLHQSGEVGLYVFEYCGGVAVPFGHTLKPLCRRALLPEGFDGPVWRHNTHAVALEGGFFCRDERQRRATHLLLGGRVSPAVEFVSNSAICERMPGLEDLPVGPGGSYISCFSYGILVFSQPQGAVCPWVCRVEWWSYSG